MLSFHDSLFHGLNQLWHELGMLRHLSLFGHRNTDLYFSLLQVFLKAIPLHLLVYLDLLAAVRLPRRLRLDSIHNPLLSQTFWKIMLAKITQTPPQIRNEFNSDFLLKVLIVLPTYFWQCKCSDFVGVCKWALNAFKSTDSINSFKTSPTLSLFNGLNYLFSDKVKGKLDYRRFENQ